MRGVAQLVSAPRSGRGGRTFESSHPDLQSQSLEIEAVAIVVLSPVGGEGAAVAFLFGENGPNACESQIFVVLLWADSDMGSKRGATVGPARQR